MDFQLTFDGDGARILKRCVDEYLERWPGGDPIEQVYLFSLQTTINAIILEDTINLEMP